jgi:NADP-dependent aldehyde dehydrogenase
VKTFLCETETKGIEGKWCLAETTLKDFNAHKTMQEEVFGPFALVVKYERAHELNECLSLFSGQLTGSIFYHNQDSKVEEWIELLSAKVGRIVLNGVPTGVRVLETMHHGGPYPASSDVRFTAVGQDSIQRFQKDVTIQVQNIT